MDFFPFFWQIFFIFIFQAALEERAEATQKHQVLSIYFNQREAELQKQLGVQTQRLGEVEVDSESVSKKLNLLYDELESYKSQCKSLKQEMEEQVCIDLILKAIQNYALLFLSWTTFSQVLSLLTLISVLGKSHVNHFFFFSLLYILRRYSLAFITFYIHRKNCYDSLREVWNYICIISCSNLSYILTVSTFLSSLSKIFVWQNCFVT